MKKPPARGESDHNQQRQMPCFWRCCWSSPAQGAADTAVPVWWPAAGTRAGWPCACAAAGTWTSSSQCHWKCQTQQPEAEKTGEKKKSAVLTLIVCRVSGKQGEALPAAGMLMEVGWSRWGHPGTRDPTKGPQGSQLWSTFWSRFRFSGLSTLASGF